MTINRLIAFGLIILAALVVTALSFMLVSLPETPMNPVGGSVSRPTPPRLESIRPFSGIVLGITPEKREMTVGTYRLENNKAVLAAQKTVKFTAETLFVRQAPTAKNPFAEAPIASTDLKNGDVVQITPVGAGDTEPLVAKKITVPSLPPPPSPR